jgi:hypothetical protein
VLDSRGTVAFLKIGIIAAFSHKVGRRCCNNLRYKIYLIRGTKASEFFVIKLWMS